MLIGSIAHTPAESESLGFSPRDRLLQFLAGQPIDRPPVFCTGGSMTAVTAEILALSNETVISAHSNSECMARIASSAAHLSGMEALGFPLFAGSEAVALRKQIARYYGNEPEIGRIGQAVANIDLFAMTEMTAVLDAIATVRLHAHPLPIIGNLTGPLKLLTELIPSLNLMQAFSKQRMAVHHALNSLTALLSSLAQAMIARGIDVLAIHDGLTNFNGNREHYFAEYGALYLNRLTAQLHVQGIPILIHLADANLVSDSRPAAPKPAAALRSAIKSRRSNSPYLLRHSGLSSKLLALSSPQRILQMTEGLLLQKGLGIITPEAGLLPETPLCNLRALTQAIKAHC